jgi:Flp pilus assembly pilin Flp
MLNLVRNFWNDEQGAIISAELVLVMTIVVIGMTVGLSEVAHAVVAELNDVGDAIGSLNQSFAFSGFHGLKTAGWGGGFGGGFGGGGFGGGFGGGGGFVKAWTPGSSFIDFVDSCDNNQCMIACDFPTPEAVPLAYGGWW